MLEKCQFKDLVLEVSNPHPVFRIEGGFIFPQFKVQALAFEIASASGNYLVELYNVSGFNQYFTQDCVNTSETVAMVYNNYFAVMRHFAD